MNYARSRKIKKNKLDFSAGCLLLLRGKSIIWFHHTASKSTLAHLRSCALETSWTVYVRIRIHPALCLASVNLFYWICNFGWSNWRSTSQAMRVNRRKCVVCFGALWDNVGACWLLKHFSSGVGRVGCRWSPKAEHRKRELEMGTQLSLCFFFVGWKCSLMCESDQLFSNLGKWTMDSKVGNRLPN